MEANRKIPRNHEVAEIQLVYKTTPSTRPRFTVNGVSKAYEVLRASWDENILELQEQFKVLLLNRANRVLGIYEASTGGMAGTVVDIRLIFVAALKAGASSIIAAHNHPSQNLAPSTADKSITEKLKNAGLLLDINIMDHIIINCDSYFSFADNGLL